MDISFVLKQLFAAYPGNKATEGTVAIYFRLLADIPPESLQTVVDQCIATCKFLPTVAEIRDEWHNLTRKIGQLSATEAWASVLSEIRRIGYIGVPYFTDALTAQVVKTLGWRELCASENQVADRAHFMRMYEQLVTRDTQVRKLLPQALDMAERNTGLTHISKFLPRNLYVTEN